MFVYECRLINISGHIDIDIEKYICFTQPTYEDNFLREERKEKLIWKKYMPNMMINDRRRFIYLLYFIFNFPT